MHIDEFDTKHRLFQVYMNLQERHDRDGHATSGEIAEKFNTRRAWEALEAKHSQLTNPDPYEHDYNALITKTHHALVTKHAGVHAHTREGTFDHMEEQRLFNEIRRVARMQENERTRPRPFVASTKTGELCNLLDTCNQEELVFMHGYITNSMCLHML